MFSLLRGSTVNLSCWLVLIRCNLLSPRGFQLPTFRAGWFSSAVMFFLSPWGFKLPTFRAGWCSSAVIFYLFFSRGFQLPFFHVHGYFSAVIFFLSPRGFQLPLVHIHGYFIYASCSCADLRTFLGLLWASMFKVAR